MSISDLIQKLTGIDFDDRATMCRYFGKMPEADRIEACHLQEDLIHQNRKEWKSRPKAEFYYAMLVLALWKMEWSRNSKALSKKSGLSQEEAEAQAEELYKRQLATFKAIRKERKKKSSPKAIAIDKKFYQRVTSLRKEGLSWREVAEYIERYYKIKISHSYLRDVYLRETKDREKRGEIETTT
jgi:hypothetical protein